MSTRLMTLVGRWCEFTGVDPELRPNSHSLVHGFPCDDMTCRPGVATCELVAWEHRHGFMLPNGLKAWLTLSDGLFLDGPLIHPLSAIGPMVPFARMPGLLAQPESWFELGNPNLETVCLDLGYLWPGGDNPIFTSGDDERRSRPRIIASSFDEWFPRVLSAGGSEYWFDRGFNDLGDPWREHCRHVPRPELADHLRLLASRVMPMIRDGSDDRAIAARLGISPFDVEAIVRHVQHARPPLAEAAGRRAF